MSESQKLRRAGSAAPGRAAPQTRWRGRQLLDPGLEDVRGPARSPEPLVPPPPARRAPTLPSKSVEIAARPRAAEQRFVAPNEPDDDVLAPRIETRPAPHPTLWRAPVADPEPMVVPVVVPLEWHRRSNIVLPFVAVISVLIIAWWVLSDRTVQSYWRGQLAGGEARPAARNLPPANVPPGEHTVVGPPTIDAAFVERVLKKYNSPAAGTGPVWIALGEKYGIDPAYALAFFIHESTAGTAPGWAGWKPDGSSTHNVGNIICAGYATCFNRFRDYPSWEAGIEDWYRLIANEYVQGRGTTTVEQIIPIYAPAYENDVAGYIDTVVGLVADWREGTVR